MIAPGTVEATARRGQVPFHRSRLPRPRGLFRSGPSRSGVPGRTTVRRQYSVFRRWNRSARFCENDGLSLYFTDPRLLWNSFCTRLLLRAFRAVGLGLVLGATARFTYVGWLFWTGQLAGLAGTLSAP